jgi:hypothetical protein
VRAREVSERTVKTSSDLVPSLDNSSFKPETYINRLLMDKHLPNLIAHDCDLIQGTDLQKELWRQERCGSY